MLFDWMRHWLFKKAAPLPLDLRGGMQDQVLCALIAGAAVLLAGAEINSEECQAGRCPGGAAGLRRAGWLWI